MSSAAPRSPKIEQWFEENGVTEYQFGEINFDLIDRGASRANQARHGAIDEDHVAILAEAMEAGVEMDPIVVLLMPGGKLKILSGNHRHAAAELRDLKSFPGYIITQQLSETQQRILASTANKANALHLSIEERVGHAIWLVENRGMQQVAAAKEIGVPVAKVKSKLQLRRAQVRLEGLGLGSKANKLGVGTKMRIDSIHNDKVLTAAVDLISMSKMTHEDANRLVTALNKERSEESQLALIDLERQRVQADILSTAGGKVPIPKVVTSIKSVLSRVSRVDLDELRQQDMDTVTRKQLKLQAAEAAERLAAIIEIL